MQGAALLGGLGCLDTAGEPSRELSLSQHVGHELNSGNFWLQLNFLTVWLGGAPCSFTAVLVCLGFLCASLEAHWVSLLKAHF